MKAIKNSTDHQAVMNQGNPVMLDFYADWCGPCQSLLPTVEKLATEFEGKVELRKVNVDDYPELAAEYGVRSIPALFFITEGKVMERLTGMQSADFLREKLQSLLN